jgi:uncharacterized protein with PQ loop repeat
MLMSTRAHARKRVNTTPPSHKRQPFDYVVYFFMVATPLFEVPQALTIYSNQSAENVSIWTWAFFCLDNLVWMFYGLRQKQWPVFFTSALYEIIEIAIVIGILVYS